MSWGKDGGNQGPWGRPSGGQNGGGRRPPEPPQPPDFDEIFRKGHDQFRRMFNRGGDDNRRMIVLAIIAVLLVWIISGVYFVKPDEQGVVLRFGEYHRTTESGIGYHIPYPFETVFIPKVTTVNRVEIGYRSGGGRISSSSNTVPEESLMLTGDENIVDISFEVQWKIDRAEDYLFNVRNPEETVKAVAESAMREVIGKTQIAKVLAEGKQQVALTTKVLIQETLNEYEAGIEVVNVNLLRVDPPAQVIEAYRDVQTARADMVTSRNQAQAYRNDILPRARGQAEQIILDAQAYKAEVVNRARGEADRFSSVYSQYQTAKDTTRRRMYLETMEETLAGMQKLIVDGDKKGSGVVPYLPLNELKPASGKSDDKKGGN